MSMVQVIPVQKWKHYDELFLWYIAHTIIILKWCVIDSYITLFICQIVFDSITYCFIFPFVILQHRTGCFLKDTRVT
jgi:hypothetical protein